MRGVIPDIENVRQAALKYDEAQKTGKAILLVANKELGEAYVEQLARADPDMIVYADLEEENPTEAEEEEEEEEKNRHIKLRHGDMKIYGFTEECAGCVRMKRGAQPPIVTTQNAARDSRQN